MKLLDIIEEIPDPRMLGKIKHSLSTIIFVSLCGILSGCETWNDIKDYCRVKKAWLSKYVSFCNGIPSGDTFRRVFVLLDSNNIEYLLRTHASAIVNNGSPTDQIAVDGKALRGSKRLNPKCLYSVSAWCHENSIVLGEQDVDGKSNEITAIPLLLESLDLEGKTITIDAAGCQKSITKLITEKKGDYVLGLKRNHATLFNAAQELIELEGEHDENRLSDYFDNSHGRNVRRRYFGYDASSLTEIKDWDGAKTIIAVESISSKNKDANQKVTAEWRYYLSSHKLTEKRLPGYIRHHWGIENKLHWVLDVHLNEDNDQKSEQDSARSFALLKRIAVNIVRTKDHTPKRSLRRKLKHSAWDDDYLLAMLS